MLFVSAADAFRLKGLVRLGDDAELQALVETTIMYRIADGSS